MRQNEEGKLKLKICRILGGVGPGLIEVRYVPSRRRGWGYLNRTYLEDIKKNEFRLSDEFF